MKQFNVGDRVLVIDTKNTERTNEEGVVVKKDNDPRYSLLVEFSKIDEDGSIQEWFSPNCLEYTKSTIVTNILNDL